MRIVLLAMLALVGCTAPPTENRSIGQRIEEALRGKEAIERDRRAAIEQARSAAQLRLVYDAALRNPVDLPVADQEKKFALIGEGQQAIRVRIKGDDGWTMWVVRPMSSSQYITWAQIDRPVRVQMRFTDGRIVETTDEPGLYIYPEQLYEQKYHESVKRRGVQKSAIRFLAEPSTNGMEILITFNPRP